MSIGNVLARFFSSFENPEGESALGAGVGAGAYATAAYLVAKYHFSDDLGVLRRCIRTRMSLRRLVSHDSSPIRYMSLIVFRERRRRISVW